MTPPIPAVSAAPVVWLLPAPVLLAGFFLPGWLAFRRLGSPLPWVTAFIGSCLLLFYTVLLLDVTGITINLPYLAVGLAFASLAGWALGPAQSAPVGGFPRHRFVVTWRECWWMLPCLVAFGSVLLRCLYHPLAGIDNFFR